MSKDKDAAKNVEAIISFCSFLTERYGSALKAWRKVLDPRGDGKIYYADLAQALSRLGWHDNITFLWTALLEKASRNSEGEHTVGLEEICPKDNKLLEGFKHWTVEQFDGALNMFSALTQNRPGASLTMAALIEKCKEHGYNGDVQVIYESALDLDGVGSIAESDIAFLEVDPLKRKAAQDPDFVMALEAAKAATARKQQRCNKLQKAQAVALREFKQKVRAASGGSFVRGWRRLLDQNGNLSVSKIDMLKGCRKIAFGGDTSALWKGMDGDDDGSVSLHEVDIRMGIVLANFKKVCQSRYGSCASAMQQLGAVIRHRSSKWSSEDIYSALKAAGFPERPEVPQKQAAMMLHEACDLSGVGSITSEDVTFLDKWEPVPWLYTDAAREEKERFLAVLRSRYVSIIVAWRRLFDQNNTNRAWYKDFCQVCRVLRFQHNVAGLWRCFDRDSRGFISLRELDNHSADVLLNFKSWAESNFGSISHAFHVFDSDGSKALSASTFKRKLRDFGFQGDAGVLFQSLKPDASSHKDVKVTLEDLMYLASWDCEPSDEDSCSEASLDTPRDEWFPDNRHRRAIPTPEVTNEQQQELVKIGDDRRWRNLTGEIGSSLSAITPPVLKPRELWYCKTAYECHILETVNHSASRSRLDVSLPKTPKKGSESQLQSPYARPKSGKTRCAGSPFSLSCPSPLSLPKANRMAKSISLPVIHPGLPQGEPPTCDLD
eukprot:TRINITY_DN21877_c0_g2_i1.p1 TRINITY_DN21877_c0_g2~~TRINITY_DN21877_c0_g2_i1.p1  ORF type:complete len:719 (+),score=126.57 TRINITY_DN21877_c0_g2_i1:73-2229(+)